MENAVKSLSYEPSSIILGNATVEIAIKKFENHLSVQIIKENTCVEQKFDFEQVEIKEIKNIKRNKIILKEIKNLDNNKNDTLKNILSNCLKKVSEVPA